MSGSFTVGALAVAAREANAIGAVRLTLLPRRLEIELLRAGTFSDGYVPGVLTRMVRFSVPYSAVRGLVRRDRGVVLSLDPTVATPYSRFFLTHFTDLPLEALAGVQRRRTIARALAWLLPLPLAAWAASEVPASLVDGAVGRGSLALVIALATALTLTTIASWVETGGPISQRLRDALERRLAQRMGFDPSSFHDTDPFELPEIELPPAIEVMAEGPVLVSRAPIARTAIDIPITFDDSVTIEAPPPSPSPSPSVPVPVPVPVPDLSPGFPPPPARVALSPVTVAQIRALPPALPPPLPPPPPLSPALEPIATVERRGRRARVLTGVVAAAVLAAGLVGYRFVERVEPAPPSPASSLEDADDKKPMAVSPSLATSSSTWPACTCERSDSPLWRTGLPVLSMMPIPRSKGGQTPETIAPISDAKGVSRYQFDVAVVNNASVPLSDVRVVVTFARRNDRGERVGAIDRGLFWEGELGPARSVKWGVKGPGTEVKIEMDETRMLGDIPPAPADGFATLLRARQPAVRLHGAMMLAYLGDPRAVESAKSLAGLSETDKLTQDRIVRAASSARICDVAFGEDHSLTACAYNGSEKALDRAAICEVGEGATRSAPLGESLPPKSGKKITIPAFGPEAEELELKVK